MAKATPSRKVKQRRTGPRPKKALQQCIARLATNDEFLPEQRCNKSQPKPEKTWAQKRDVIDMTATLSITAAVENWTFHSSGSDTTQNGEKAASSSAASLSLPPLKARTRPVKETKACSSTRRRRLEDDVKALLKR